MLTTRLSGVRVSLSLWGQTVSLWGQTELEVNLILGLTRMAVPEDLTRFPQSILGLLPGLG